MMVTSNASRIPSRHTTDVAFLTPYAMRAMEMMAIGICDVFIDAESGDVTLRPEGMSSMSLTVYAETFNDLVSRGLVERFSNSVALAYGVYLGS